MFFYQIIFWYHIHTKINPNSFVILKNHVDKCGPIHKINFNNLTLDIHVKKTQ